MAPVTGPRSRRRSVLQFRERSLIAVGEDSAHARHGRAGGAVPGVWPHLEVMFAVGGRQPAQAKIALVLLEREKFSPVRVVEPRLTLDHSEPGDVAVRIVVDVSFSRNPARKFAGRDPQIAGKAQSVAAPRIPSELVSNFGTSTVASCIATMMRAISFRSPGAAFA